jgi:peptidoglycan/LPS O-acetylase OafA/YrhL
MRALAVLLVVLYHAHVPGFDSGFVGVDVFFVISGFLITQLLTHELEVTDTLGLGRFWARRARRLLPAATLMVVVVLAATLATSTVLHWQSAATEAMSTSLYWSNELFARRATDYFGSGISSSPLLHTWSLAVEEQFYLLWPLLLLGATRLATRSGSSPSRLRAGAVALVTVGSLAIANSLHGSPAAFFSASSRAWELGAGALLALAPPTLVRRISPRMRAGLGVLGACLLVATVVALGGRAAASVPMLALPVLGTTSLLAAGMGGSWPGIRVFTSSAAQYVGRLSYSWYLWHWPVLVIGLAYLPRDSVFGRGTLVAASLVPAVVTHHLVEGPLRRQPKLTASPRATLLLGIGVITVALVAAGATWVGAEWKLRDPFLRELVQAREDRPPLDEACATTNVQDLEARCVLGDPNSTRVVLVIGDSHAAQWLPAIDLAARSAHFKVVASVQGNCPAVGHGWTQALPSCIRRLRLLPGAIDEMHPNLVIVASSSGYIGGLVDAEGRRIPATQQLAAWGDAHVQLARHLRASAIGLVDVLDIPRRPSDPIDCLARGRSPDRCDMARDDADASVASVHQVEAAALIRAGHGSVLDPVSLVCGTSVCPLIRHGVVMYTDDSHLTATFGRSLAPMFGEQRILAAVP